MNDFEKQCYGCTEAALNQAMDDAIDPLMLAMSILSDAQEVISGEFGEPDTERARKYMNRAKYIMSRLMQDAREMEAA